MKKRILSLAIAATFAFGALCACSSGDKPNTDNNPPVTGDQTPDDGTGDGNNQTPDATTPEIIEGRETVSAEDMNTFKADYMTLFGRTTVTGTSKARRLNLGHAGTGIEVSFYGTSLKASLGATNTVYFRAFVDGDGEGARIAVRNGTVTLAEGLTEGVHTVKLIKATSSQNSALTVKSLETDGKFLRPEQRTALKIEFVGDSITVGAGILAKSTSIACKDENTDATMAYSYLTAKALGMDCSLVATEGICTHNPEPYALPFSMLDSMYTQISSTNTTPYSFDTKQDVVVVALGENDGSYMGSHPAYTAAQYTEDYKALLTLVREKNQDAYIVCAYGMMGKNATVWSSIQAAITAFGDEKVSSLELPADRNGASAHPSAEGAGLQSATLVAHLKTVLGLE